MRDSSLGGRPSTAHNFWLNLPRPFFVLAPMADVTDIAFRTLITKYAKPDVLWTEFVSADGLASPGRIHLMRDLAYNEAERPIVAQLFTANPEKMEESARFVASLGFDGIDINMGCPDKNVEKQGAGASLLRDPDRAVALIASAKRGAPNLPISVKTRMGWAKDDLDTWLPILLSARPSVITLHARTRKELSQVEAHWDAVKRASDIVAQWNTAHQDEENILLIGNGDVQNMEDAHQKARASGVDGVMIGRAVFGNPWLFCSVTPTLTIRERLHVMVEHTRLFSELLADIKNFAIMKKHFKAYVTGWEGARELRTHLMEEGNSFPEVQVIVEDFLHRHPGVGDEIFHKSESLTP